MERISRQFRESLSYVLRVLGAKLRAGGAPRGPARHARALGSPPPHHARRKTLTGPAERPCSTLPPPQATST